MNTDAIAVWVRRKRASGIASCWLMAAVALLLGVVVLFLTFWFTYAILWFGGFGISAISELTFGKRLSLAHEWRLAICGLFLVLLFVQLLVTHPSHWGDYPKRDYVAAPGLQGQAGVVGALGFMLAYPGASANMVADILLMGPRLVMSFWHLGRQARRLAQLDAPGCATLIEFLASRPTAVPYEELREAGWDACFEQLRLVEGVVFLEKGLGLSGEFRQELASAEKQ